MRELAGRRSWLYYRLPADGLALAEVKYSCSKFVGADNREHAKRVVIENIETMQVQKPVKSMYTSINCIY